MLLELLNLAGGIYTEVQVAQRAAPARVATTTTAPTTASCKLVDFRNKQVTRCWTAAEWAAYEQQDEMGRLIYVIERTPKNEE